MRHCCMESSAVPHSQGVVAVHGRSPHLKFFKNLFPNKKDGQVGKKYCNSKFHYIFTISHQPQILMPNFILIGPAFTTNINK